MPDERVLERMYGPDYAGRGPKDGDVDGVCDRDWVASWLRKRSPLDGPFVDYGCGHGELLAVGRAAGCKVAGVEFGAEVALRAAQSSGERVFAAGEPDLSELDGRVAVLHLGDVIEHLTRPYALLREILRLLGPDGVLLAQGPLEAQANLFNVFLRAKRVWSKDTPANLPPYHVLLATAVGQRALFERLGLRQVEFLQSEVDWPAPSRFSPAMLRQPRAASLYFARRLSRRVSAFAPNYLGNRYCYAGVPAGPS
jgi:SAM-dependent methyltransferase